MSLISLAVKLTVLSLKEIEGALASIAQWIECGTATQRVTGLIPSQCTCLCCQPGPL